MLRSAGVLLILSMPLREAAWDDGAVLSFIGRVNPNARRIRQGTNHRQAQGAGNAP